MNRKSDLGNNLYISIKKEGIYMIKEDLNLFLSNLNVFYRKLQNYHWNIVGEDFFNIHSKLEELYNDINDDIDEIAEHILSIGEMPYASLKEYLEIAQIKEASSEKRKSKDILETLLKDYNILIENVTKIKEDADNQNRYSTSALMDEYLQKYEKNVWMIRQTIM